MKRIFAILLLLAMLAAIPALAEGADDLSAYIVAAEPPLYVDLDGDGANEGIGWAMVPNEYGEAFLTLTVTTADGEALTYPTSILYGAVYLADLDGDGAAEILLSGDVMSDDYYTFCVRYADGALTEVLFADVGRGDNGDGYHKYGYGAVTAIDGNRLTLCGSQDVLGTWMAARDFTLTPAWRFETADDGLWRREADLSDAEVWDYAALRLKAALPYADPDGNPAGTLQPGDSILITASDKREIAYFAAPGGVQGTLKLSPDYEKGWGWLVNGQSEDALFEYVPYAD